MDASLAGVVQLLLEVHPDATKEKDEYGRFPLSVAAANQLMPEPAPEPAPAREPAASTPSPSAVRWRAGPDWSSERFALPVRPVPAPWASDGVDGIPTLQSLCLLWLAGRLEDVESLEGLPEPFTELACFAAGTAAPWRDDPRSLWTDPLLTALTGDGIATLDLSGSPGVTDGSLRFLASHLGMRETLRHISVASTSVTLRGLSELLTGCGKLEYIDLSYCGGVVPERIGDVLPSRTPPEAWEQEADETWRHSYPALSTIVFRDAPAPVVVLLAEQLPWIRVNPPDWEGTPMQACSLRCELLCPPCLWVRPSEVAERASVQRASQRAEQERALGRWGPAECSPRPRPTASFAVQASPRWT